MGDVGAAAEEGCLEFELTRLHAARKDMATTNTAIGFLTASLRVIGYAATFPPAADSK